MRPTLRYALIECEIYSDSFEKAVAACVGLPPYIHRNGQAIRITDNRQAWRRKYEEQAK